MKFAPKKLLALVLMVTIVSQSAIVLKPKTTYAEGILTGFSMGGILGTAADCIIPGGLNNETVTNVVKDIFMSKAAKEKAAQVLKDSTEKVAVQEGIAAGAKAATEAIVTPTSVPIHDTVQSVTNTEDRVVDAIKDSLFSDNYLRNISDKQNQAYKKTHCLDMIVHMITMKVVDKMTLATVDWINTGFQGQPLFLEDAGQFFGDIAKEEVNGITSWFACSGVVCDQNYPFGKMVMQSVLTQIQGNLQADMKFKMNQILANGTYEQFRADFSVGGWAGYTSFLEPQNNPLGNYLLIKEGLGRQIAGTSANRAQRNQKQIDLSGGFLNQKKCVASGTGVENGADYIGPLPDGTTGPGFIDPTSHPLIPEGTTMTEDIWSTLSPEVQGQIDASGAWDSIETAQVYNNLVLRSTCAKWMTITPGSLISNQLTKNFNLQTDKLINAGSLGQNLGLIFDALLNQLVEKGLRSLDQTTNGNDSVLVQQVNGQNPGSSGLTDPDGNSIDGQTSTAETLLGDGLNLNIQNIQNIQNDYIQAAVAATGDIGDVIDRIRALDYCVPGPNPKWQEDSSLILSQALTNLPPPPGTSVQDNANFYRDMIQTLTGVTVQANENISNQAQFTIFMNNLFTQFSNKMLSYYSLNQAPPNQRPFLSIYFNQLPDYLNDLQSLADYLTNIQPLLQTLANIEVALDNLLQQNNGNPLDPNDPAVQVQIALFNSISGNLATQGQLDSLNTQMQTYGTLSSLIGNSHVDDCALETGAGYQYPNQRVSYPPPLFTYQGMPALPPPSPNNSFFPQGVVFGSQAQSQTNPDVINVEVNGITVNGTTDTSTFATLLQSALY